MDNSNVLDHQHSPAAIPIRESMREVSRLTGKSAATQLREMLDLFHGPGHLSPGEYFYFRLYDDERFSAAEKRRFLGHELQHHILQSCTDRRWWAVGHDKVAFYGLMQSYGLPVPPVVATLHPFRRLTGARPLRNTEEAADFLRDQVDYPLFAKPFNGMRSVGSARIDAYDAITDELIIYPQRRVPVSQFIESLTEYAESGYLFQEVQHPHDTVRALCGDRLASVRFVLIVGEQGPEPFRAVWKFPSGPHIADNYWRKGNLLAGIDMDSGRVTRVMTGVGTERVEVQQHPDSGVSFKDLSVPDWLAMKELCLSAATTMPGITMQGWDVAPCAQGPVLVEVNIGGDFTLPQLGNEVGLLDDQFAEYLARHHFQPRSFAHRAGNYVSKNVRWAAANGIERAKLAFRHAPPRG